MKTGLFPDQSAGLGRLRPFRKMTLDVDGVEAVVPPVSVYERQQMSSGKLRLVAAASPAAPELFRTLVRRLAAPLFLLYVLHTPRGEGEPGRYQSPSLDGDEVEGFLSEFEAYLAGDGRHDIWAYSPAEGRTLIWDRHDLIYVEGEPLEDMTAVLEASGYRTGEAPRWGAGPHIHHYREEFDEDAAAVLARFDWIRSDLRPEDEQ